MLPAILVAIYLLGYVAVWLFFSGTRFDPTAATILGLLWPLVLPWVIWYLLLYITSYIYRMTK